MKLTDDMQTGTVKGFTFSGVRPEKLGATEYTLFTLIIDITGSTIDFAQELLQVKKTTVEACKKSPRADNILLRVLEFNTTVTEVHGFMPLAAINTNDYTVPNCGGLTALTDAALSGVVATGAYAKQLWAQDYLSNAIVVATTDGVDNHSHAKVSDLRAEMERLTKDEALESLLTILVGVNVAKCKAELDTWQQEAGFSQFVDIGDATPQRLAKLADFVSRSVSAQSQSLGTGGPSQALRF